MSMKLLTFFGTRPEIIRLSRIIPLLDRLCEHTLVHTGQNYDPNLSDIFFRDLGLRPPNLHLGVRGGNFAEQLAQIFVRSEQILRQASPDRVLILGDTNSGMAAVIAARMGIPVYHLEAGNRCYDDRVPEEINRRIIDHSSTVLLPYTGRSKDNLVREGIAREKIFVVGNPIHEVLQANESGIAASGVHARLGLVPGEYFVVTLHRAENVDARERLESIVNGLRLVVETYRKPMVLSLHPRTADKVRAFSIDFSSRYFQVIEPLGFFDFVSLERRALCVLTDSGTVQEECAILKVPNVTVRDVTERPETLECGSNLLTGAEPESILRAVNMATQDGPAWNPPSEYLEPNVSRIVANIVLGYRHTAACDVRPRSEFKVA